MNDLSEFLRFLNARLDEDEAAARRAGDYGGCCAGCACGCEPSTTRLLREVEAKRQLFGEVQRELADDPTNQTAQWLASTLALPYADHQDYRDEWRP